MTEGPTARLRALQIEKEFKGQILQDIFTRSKKIYTSPKNLIGKRLEKATSYGKNILLYFDGYVIRIHLMLYGSIRFENEFSKPFSRVRLCLSFPHKKLVVYNAPIIEIDLANKMEKKLMESYGIDPLTNWDKKKLIELILRNKERKIGDLLLDQTIFNGVGNILRNEILFRAGINPERKVNELSMEEIENLVIQTKRLMQIFLKMKMKGRGIKDLLFVYNKKRCMRCNAKIIFYRQEPNGRKTFYCPNCQK